MRGPQPPVVQVTARQLALLQLLLRRRSGTPRKFTPEQVVHVVGLACEKLEDCWRPISHWMPRELADEAQKRGIVQTISARSVGRCVR